MHFPQLSGGVHVWDAERRFYECCSICGMDLGHGLRLLVVVVLFLDYCNNFDEHACRCGVLQCVAASCRVLWCVVVCCGVLQCVAVCAVCCSVLQSVAVCCSVLQCFPACCSVLHYVAVCCSYSATWCSAHVFTCVTWLIHIYDMTHSHVWHDLFTFMTWLIHMCDMMHPCVWHDSSTWQVWGGCDN